MTIWFPFLCCDYHTIKKPGLQQMPFVLAAPDHGKMKISQANKLAVEMGVNVGMAVADARVLIPGLEVIDDRPGLEEKLLKRLAAYCIRFSPHVAVDLPAGLKLDITGCAHLWKGEVAYLQHIVDRLEAMGFTVRVAIADTIGAAWAICRYGEENRIILTGDEYRSLQYLPPACLRIDAITQEKLYKLGCYQLSSFMQMPLSALQRRFGKTLIQRIRQALGTEEEWILPVMPDEAWLERLPCLEPIVTATGISIALQRLLDSMCTRLNKAEKGLRTAVFYCYRVDGKMQKLEISTTRASDHSKHLYKLFEVKLDTIEPDLGIELFVLEAKGIEEVAVNQKTFWENPSGIENKGLTELLDRLAGKIGHQNIHRYVPAEHYWPERAFKEAISITEKPTTGWPNSKPRPVQLLSSPHVIEVSAPIPDYPPMLFRYKNKLHRIVKADGPERIEQEWWLQQGEHRDYYTVEDELGQRYWIFRSGHYMPGQTRQWFLHGFFA
jgi:protein ImuB